MTFESSMKRLDEIVKALEGDNLSLEESLEVCLQTLHISQVL